MKDEHLNHLDGWRGLAITFLLIGHFFPIPGIPRCQNSCRVT